MPRRRLMLFLALCLISGAILTVLTSWACAAFPFTARIGYHNHVESRPGLQWPAPVPVDWPPPEHLIHVSALGRRYVTAFHAPGRSLRYADAAKFGLPLPAMGRHSFQLSTWGLGSITDPDVHTGLSIPSLDSDPIAGSPARLPLRPIPLGFAANTLLYAAAIAGLITLARRLRQPRPGLCPHCRYDLTGNPSSICPECGTPHP